MRPPDAVDATLSQHLHDRAASYFPDLAGQPVEVVPARRSSRRFSSLERFELCSGRVRHAVLVKAALSPADAPEPVDRPGIGTLLAPRTRMRFEHAAMTAIGEHFVGLGDPRFDAIRVLDLLADDRAIVMEESPHPDLRSLLLRTMVRLGPGPAAVEAACRHAGAWLRQFHELRSVAHAEPRRTRREDFVQSVRDFATYLGAAGVDAGLLRDLVTRVESAARQLLPAALPLGVAHGDFAPRNVLVGPGSSVSVIDTSGRWRVPIYQDIVFFLTALDVMGLRLLSRGLAIGSAGIRGWRQEFLRGYFSDDPTPLAELRLFELECLLDRWSSATHLHRRARGLGRFGRRLGLAVKGRFFVRRLQELLAGLDAPATPTQVRRSNSSS